MGNVLYRGKGSLTHVENTIFFDHGLSAKAKGIYCQIRSLEGNPEWVFTIKEFERLCSISLKPLTSLSFKRDCLKIWTAKVAAGLESEQIIDAYTAYAKADPEFACATCSPWAPRRWRSEAHRHARRQGRHRADHTRRARGSAPHRRVLCHRPR